MPRHKFQPGHKKLGGRKVGTPNKIPRELRALVQDVMVDLGHGEDAEERARSYLHSMAIRRPKLFIGLLARTIEQQVKVTANVREVVRIIDLTGLDLADPKVRKRLGPYSSARHSQEAPMAARATDTAAPAKAPRLDPDRFGPCSDCRYYMAGEGLGSSVGKGRCHGMPPMQGMWPGVPANAKGCSLFRARG